MLRETNDAEIVGEFTASVGDVISGVVQQGRDPKMINVNLGRVEGRIPPQEQVPGEVYNHGDRIKCFVVEVKQGLKGPEIMLSRSHPALVKQLFAFEVPEMIALLKSWRLRAKQDIAQNLQLKLIAQV